VRSALERLRDNGFTISNDNEVLLFTKSLLQEPLHLSQKHIFIILDGLDEIENPSESEPLIKSLAALSKKQLPSEAPIRMLILSRPHFDVNQLVPDFSSVAIDYCDQQNDIQAYVKHVIAESKDLQVGFEKTGIDPL
jgi:hypothetical protein